MTGESHCQPLASTHVHMGQRAHIHVFTGTNHMFMNGHKWKKSILTGTINYVITQEWKDSLAGEGFAMRTGIWAPESLLNKQRQGQQNPIYLNMNLQSQWWEGGDVVNPWASLPRQPHLLSDLQASERSCLRKNTRWCHQRNDIYIHVHIHVRSHDISPNAHAHKHMTTLELYREK